MSFVNLINTLYDGIRQYVNQIRITELVENEHDGLKHMYDFLFDVTAVNDALDDDLWDGFVLSDPMLEEINHGKVHKKVLEGEALAHDIYGMLC